MNLQKFRRWWLSSAFWLLQPLLRGCAVLCEFRAFGVGDLSLQKADGGYEKRSGVLQRHASDASTACPCFDDGNVSVALTEPVGADETQDAGMLGAYAHSDTDEEVIFFHEECELRLNAMIAAETVFSGSIPNFIAPYSKNDIPVVPPSQTRFSEKFIEHFDISGGDDVRF